MEARFVRKACTEGRIGLLPGSFNPPTNAHLALGAAGRRAGLGCVYYLLSRVTVDKERVTGIPLDERLRLLQQIVGDDGIATTERGLYVDQARAMRPLLPDAELVFLVGHDKIVQIFDPRYYDDREAALSQLFELASFLVAPRAHDGPRELTELLQRPQNWRYASRVGPLELEPEHRDASSTRVRQGESDDVPAAVARYLAERKPFS